jgi:hypothetical protein
VAGCERDAELSVRRGLDLYPWQSYMSTVLQSLRKKQFAKQAERAMTELLKAKVKAAVEVASKKSTDSASGTDGSNDSNDKDEK